MLTDKKELKSIMDFKDKIHNLSFNNEEIIILRALCDLALKSGGMHNFQSVSLIINKIADIDIPKK